MGNFKIESVLLDIPEETKNAMDDLQEIIQTQVRQIQQLKSEKQNAIEYLDEMYRLAYEMDAVFYHPELMEEVYHFLVKSMKR